MMNEIEINSEISKPEAVVSFVKEETQSATDEALTAAHRAEELQRLGQQLKLFENTPSLEFSETESVHVVHADVVNVNVTHSHYDEVKNDAVDSTNTTINMQSIAGEKTANNLVAALSDESLIKEIENIPQTLAFKIGDVADMLGIKQYVLRYWETEFDILKPKKAANNQRMYSRADVENAYLVRKLLHRDRFSIEGAKQVLKSVKTQVKKDLKTVEAKHIDLAKIEKVEAQLQSLSNSLKNLKKLFL